MLDARPKDRLITRGMTREVVGGSFSGVRGMVNVDPAKPERGLTFPLTVLNTSQEFAPVDTDRKFLYVVNNDALGVVWLAFGGAAAVVGQGIRLAPNGGGILLDMNVPTARIFLIGTIANNPNVSMVTG